MPLSNTPKYPTAIKAGLALSGFLTFTSPATLGNSEVHFIVMEVVKNKEAVVKVLPDIANKPDEEKIGMIEGIGADQGTDRVFRKLFEVMCK